MFVHREIQAQEALQNGQLGSGEGIPDLQPGVLASQAMIEKTLTEDPRWKGVYGPLNWRKVAFVVVKEPTCCFFWKVKTKKSDIKPYCVFLILQIPTLF